MRNKYKGEDIRQRLHGTIIRYRGIPYIADVNNNTIGLMDIAKGELVLRVEPDDPFLDISSAPLGYVNIVKLKIASYIRREPLRKYKQGIDISYITQKPLVEDEASMDVSNRHLYSQELIDCITGKYPTFASAKKMLTSLGWTSVAISNNIALKRVGANLEVYVKDLDAGYMKINETVVHIKKSPVSWAIKKSLEDIKDWNIIEE